MLPDLANNNYLSAFPLMLQWVEVNVKGKCTKRLKKKKSKRASL